MRSRGPRCLVAFLIGNRGLTLEPTNQFVEFDSLYFVTTCGWSLHEKAQLVIAVSICPEVAGKKA
jgi:hypothetical protein